MKNHQHQDDLDLYFRIFNTLKSPIFLKDENYRFVLVNDACCSMFQIPRDQFEGKKDSELFPVKEWEVFRKVDDQILSTGIAVENEEDATVAGGPRLRVLTRKSLLTSQSGKKYVLGITTDITEKKELLERLQENEEKYKTIFSLGSDPAGLFMYPERVAIEVNDAFLQLGGITRQSVIGNTATHAFSWVDDHEREQYFQILEREKEVRNLEIHMKNRKGEVRTILASAKMLFINKKCCVLSSLHDVTELKAAESMLRESEQMYREMVDNSPIPLFIHRDGVIVFANEAAGTLTGTGINRLLRRKLAQVLKIPAAKSTSRSINPSPLEPDQNKNSSTLIIETPEGVPRNYILRNVRIRYKGEEAVMTKVLDITERQNLENYITNRILEAEENERKRFATDLHDDLGPLLSTIKLHLGLLEKAKDPQRTQKSIETFNALLDEVIAKVHDISHSISPHLIEDFGLDGAVTDFCHRINDNQVFLVYLRHNIHHLRFPREVELHYYRIICELLNNSMKHGGTREMSVDLHHTGGILKLRYSDNGSGYQIREILKSSKGMGISNIIHRVGLISGDIRFSREKGKTVVTVKTRVAPIEPPREHLIH